MQLTDWIENSVGGLPCSEAYKKMKNLLFSLALSCLLFSDNVVNAAEEIDPVLVSPSQFEVFWPHSVLAVRTLRIGRNVGSIGFLTGMHDSNFRTGRLLSLMRKSLAYPAGCGVPKMFAN